MPRSWTSMKTCESKELKVESKGDPGMVGSTWSAAATEWLGGSLSAIVRRAKGFGSGSRGKESYDLLGGEASVAKAVEDAGDGVEGLGDETVGSGSGGDSAAEEEFEAGRALAVGETDGASELDAIRLVEG